MGLSLLAKSLWAKKAVRNNQVVWLPLYVHLSDTSNVIRALAKSWLAPGVWEWLQTDWLDEDQLLKFITWLGAVHDLGKATPAFQGQPAFKDRQIVDEAIDFHLAQAGWQEINKWSSLDHSKSRHELAGETLLMNWGVDASIASIIGAHHGRPTASRNISDNQLVVFPDNYYANDSDRWKQVQKEIFNYGLELAGYKDVGELPNEVPFSKSLVLEGLLIMADWLSSSESTHGKNLFSLMPIDKKLKIDLNDRAQNALNIWWNFGVKGWTPDPIYDPQSLYERRFGFNPRSIQAQMTELIAKAEKPGLLVIEAAMGIGKTEIALVAAEQLMAKTQRNGVLFALPTQATTDAMFTRVNDWLTAVAEETGATLPVILKHGKAMFNQEFKDLPEASEEYDDEDLVLKNRWFDKKKSLLTPFVICTIDEVLAMALKKKHVFLREMGIANKVLILDEVHSFDTYMDSYLEKALTFCGAFGVPVILLSATLPHGIKQRLVKAYRRGMGYRKTVKLSTGYPSLTLTDGEKVVSDTSFPINVSRQIVIKQQIWDPENRWFNGIIKRLETGDGIIGVIVNTVASAQNLAKITMKSNPHLPFLLLHSQLVTDDRHEREVELQHLIGKHGKRPRKLLVIGTQVLEQSLDIDFDILYTELAPMDLILQRIGRLQRHKRSRPHGYECPQATILIPNEEQGRGSQAIYTQYLLERTRLNLPEVISLPDEIELLVAKVYDNLDIDQVGYRDFKERQEVAKRRAGTWQIQTSKIFSRHDNTLFGLIEGQVSKGTDVEPAVRDGDEQIEVIPLVDTEYGLTTVNGQPIEELSGYDLAQLTLRLPARVTNFNYEDVITELEKMTADWVPNWRISKWLKGQLGLVFNSNLQVRLGNYQLFYDQDLGLITQKLPKNENNEGKVRK